MRNEKNTLNGINSRTYTAEEKNLQTWGHNNCMSGKKGQKERVRARQKSVFYNLTLGKTSHHFCLILFIKCKPLVLAHTQGEVITPKHKSRKWESLGAILEADYHSNRNYSELNTKRVRN